VSTLQGIDRAPYIVGSVRNQAQQLLRRRTNLRDECGTKHNRHSLAVPRDWTLSQIVIILVQTYGISRSHLNHRCQHYKISIMLKKSRSPRSSIEGFCPGTEILSISWFEQLKLLVWRDTKRNNCKLLVRRQVNQEAMPVGTDRCSGEWRLCSCRLHLPMHLTPLCIHWNEMMDSFAA